MAQAQIPDDLSADYENVEVRAALAALQETPDYASLVSVLESLREGYLVADVTGSQNPAQQNSTENAAKKKGGKKRGTRVRVIRSTAGQLVLPLFTSMAQLRATVTDVQHEQLRGAMMPAREALNLITTDRFTAAEFDKGAPHSLVLLRKYVTLAAGGDEVTVARLEGMR